MHHTPLTPVLASCFAQSLFDPLHNGPTTFTHHTVYPLRLQALYAANYDPSRTITMYRPMMFSAAHSALFEEARRQSQERVQPKFLWKRGFHSEGGMAGWGYYLEPAPSEVPSTIDEEQEEAEGSAAAKDVEDDGHEMDGHEDRERVGHAGAAKRPNSQGTGYPASRAKVISSHGAFVASCLFPPPLIHHHPQRVE